MMCCRMFGNFDIDLIEASLEVYPQLIERLKRLK